MYIEACKWASLEIYSLLCLDMLGPRLVGDEVLAGEGHGVLKAVVLM